MTLANGQKVKAKDLPEKFKLVSWNPCTGWGIAEGYKWAQYQQETIEIETSAGRICRVSEEHPFWTPSGWVPINKLKIDDFVSVARKHGTVLKTHNFYCDRAWLLGFLLGDGGLTEKSRVKATIADPLLVNEVRKITDQCGWMMRNTTPRNPGIIWSLSGRPLIKWIRELGLEGTGSHTKFIPDSVFSWDQESVLSLISGFIEADGTVTDGNAGRTVELYSVSHTMLQGLQSLLLRYGMQSRLVEKKGRYKGEEHLSWRLTLCGSSIDVLSCLGDNRGPKIQRLQNQRKRTANDSFDLIPDELVDKIPDRFTKLKSPRLDNRRPIGHQRWKVLERCKGLPIQHDAELSWERIKSIKSCGVERTWSIEVPGISTLLVEDFVTHNTTQIPIGRVLYEIGNDTNLRIKIVCQSDGKSIERLFEIITHIEENERLHEIFPNLKSARRGSWTKHKIVVARDRISKDASVEAIGVRSTATGGRADILVADDVVDRLNALEFPALREQIKAAWKSDWTQLLEPDGRLWYICTLWHTSDLSHELMRNPVYKVLKYGIGKGSDSFKPIWPTKWGRKELKDRELEIGKREMDRSFRNIALSGDVQMVLPDWIKYYDPKSMPDLKDMVRVSGVDPRGAQEARNNKADYFARVTLGYHRETNKIYILDAWKGRPSFLNQMEKVKETWRLFKELYIGIEANNYQDALRQVLMESESFPLVPMKPGNQRKEERLRGITPYIESGMVLWPNHFNPEDPAYDGARQNLFEELTGFPLWKNDDLVDAFVWAMRLLLDYVIIPEKVGDGGDDEDEGGVTVRAI